MKPVPTRYDRVVSRRRVRLRAAALGVTAALAAPAPASDLAEVKARGELRVLVMPAPDEAHFFSLDPAGDPGFDQEIVAGFARLHDVKLTVVPVSAWGELVPALLAGRGDLIAGTFTATAARRQQIDFSVEVFPTRIVAVTRAPRPAVESVAGLRELTVGCIAGSSPAEALKGAGVPAARIDDRIPSGGLVAALVAGRVEAAVMEVPAAILAQRDDPSIRIGAFLGPPGSLAYGMRKQDTELRRALDEFLENQRRGMGWNRLVVKYFGEAAPEILKRTRGE